MSGTALPMRWRPAANAEPRRNNRAVDMIVLHYTGMDSAAAACDLLCAAEGKVSCHYLVDEDGAITAMVDEAHRAWHAGASFWKGETDTNSRSIGIEIHNPGHGPFYRDFPQPQMQAVAALCRDILSRHAIPPQHVLAHSDVAPGRKIDPGERFDWQYLHAQGIGHWVPPSPPGDTALSSAELLAFQRLLAAYGYDIGATGTVDERTRKATDAFTRHFRPAVVTSLPDISALRTAERLIKACGKAR